MLQIALNNDEGFKASLSLNYQTIKRFSPLTPKRICITNLYSAERRRIERFIEQKFRYSYRAEITHHYPILMSVHDEDDNILAALGFRYANEESLFLEHYLNTPIEAALSQAYRTNISRHDVTEIGNLASDGQGASIFLFTALNAYLEQQGKTVNVVTATDFLHRYFKKLGLKSKELAKANQSLLADGGLSWGSYYDENPRVIAGHVSQVLIKLRKHLQVVLEESETEMVTRIHHPSMIEDVV